MSLTLSSLAPHSQSLLHLRAVACQRWSPQPRLLHWTSSTAAGAVLCSQGLQAQLALSSILARSSRHGIQRRKLGRCHTLACSAQSATSSAAASKPAHICVVGAGVVGLTSALRLLTSLPEGSVKFTVVADRFGTDTTTTGAAGLWGPYCLSQTPESDVLRWSRETYDYLCRLAHSAEAARAGVSLVTAISLQTEPRTLASCTSSGQPQRQQEQHQHPPSANTCSSSGAGSPPQQQQQRHMQASPLEPFWRDVPINYRVVDGAELDRIGLDGSMHKSGLTALTASTASTSDNGTSSTSSTSQPLSGGDAGASSGTGGTAALSAKYKWGYAYVAPVCEGARYLRWITLQLEARGVVLWQRSLTSLSDLAAEGYDAIIDCCGIGASALLHDSHVYPIRGQVMRVRAPWVTQAVFSPTNYVIPNPISGTVVLGGTAQVGNWSTATDLSDKWHIWEGCCELLPSLRDAEVMTDWVGLRPGRRQLRLEAETVTVPAASSATSISGVGSSSFGNDESSSSSSSSSTYRKVPVLHNYGHGGAGLTLAWGCAGDVVQWVQGLLQARNC